MRVCDEVNRSYILALVHSLGALHGNLTPRDGCEYAANEISQTHFCTSPVSQNVFWLAASYTGRWRNPNWDALLYERVGGGWD